MTVTGNIILNWPEQSHSPMISQPHSGKPRTQGCNLEMFKTRNDAVIALTSRCNNNVNARAAVHRHLPAENQENDGQTGPVLRQGSAHKRKPKGALRKTTVRWPLVLGQGSACAREGGAVYT